MKATMKVVVGILSVFLTLSLVANAYLYLRLNSQNKDQQRQVANLNEQILNQANIFQSEKADLESQIVNLTAQIDVLQQQINNSQSIIVDLQTQNVNLTNQLNQINNPRLITQLGITDVREPEMRPNIPPNDYLLIEGRVEILGNKPAYHCLLKVTAYQGSNIAISTNIQLGSGTMNPGAYVDVSVKLPYQGDYALTHWDVIPQWTNSP
jgi:TolA-binding protein